MTRRVGGCGGATTVFAQHPDEAFLGAVLGDDADESARVDVGDGVIEHVPRLGEAEAPILHRVGRHPDARRELLRRAGLGAARHSHRSVSVLPLAVSAGAGGCGGGAGGRGGGRSGRIGGGTG